MKLVLISDTHTGHRNIQNMPEGDVLIHAGDICQSMGAGAKHNMPQIEAFNIWLGELPYKHKIVIAGNHDFPFQHFPEYARPMITNGTYLQDEAVTIDGVKFYGSPWQPWFGGWAFNAERGAEIDKHWQKIPDDTDVLITHGPPHGILDEVRNQYGRAQHTGCEMLLKRVNELQQLKLHVFGHIHVGRGHVMKGETAFFNAAVVNHRYKVVHGAYTWEI